MSRRERNLRRTPSRPERTPPSAPEADPAVNSALVAELAAAIRSITGERDLAETLAIGELLYTRCYGGSGPGTAESPTIHALSRVPDLGKSRATLYRAVQVYLQHRELPADVRDDLTLSQHYGVTSLPSGPVKDEIARAAVEDRTSARDLSAQVRGVREGAAPRQGGVVKASLPPLSEVLALLSPWRSRTATTAAPSARDAERLLTVLDAIVAICAELRPWLLRAAGR